MLNSAAGVMLPSAMEPPITTMRSRPSPPCSSRKRATFVSGPVATSTTGRSLSSTRSSMKPTASSERAAPLGGGRDGPSRPLSPCTCAATATSRVSGAAAPAATGTSSRPASSRTRRAFVVVLSSVWFPYVVVTPSSSSSGLPSCEQQRDRVVVPRIAVEQHGDRRHPRSIVAAMAGVREKVRAFALSLPGAVEDHPWGEDVVKVRGKIFVFLGPELSRVAADLGQARRVERTRALHRRRRGDGLRAREGGLGHGPAPGGGRERGAPPRMGRGELPHRRSEAPRGRARRRCRPDDLVSNRH